MVRESILEKLFSYPKPLSPEQKKAVSSDENYIKVLAGAGAGKTETLTRRIIYLILVKKVDPSNIVAFTFTEKAASSIKSRIHERVRQLQDEEACARLGKMYVGTIHSFCLQILQDFFGYGGHDVIDENQEMAFLMRVGWDLELNHEQGPYWKNCQNFKNTLEAVYNELVPRNELKGRSPRFLNRLEKYENLLEEHRLITFGKMIYDGVENINNNPEKLNYINHLIVDEYQDINHAQEMLIKLIGRKSNVFVVGDPRQCIYQWRGSDERCFDEFENHFPGAKTFIIKENRRSGKNIVDIANKFADSFEEGYYPHIKEIGGEPGAVYKIKHKNISDEAKWISSQIQYYIENDICNYNDFGILLRSIATSGASLIEVFKAWKIPYIVGGKIGLFRREEAQAVGRLFAWLSSEGFWVESQYNWRERTTDDDLLESGLYYWQQVTGIEKDNTIISNLFRWKNRVQNEEFKNLTEIYNELLTVLGIHHLAPEDKHNAVTLANLGRFSSLLSDYEFSYRLGGRRPRSSTITKGLCWYINTVAAGGYEEQHADDLRGINAVQINTVHQAKGLEWPIVFVPGLVKNRFPTSKIGNKKPWLIPRELFDADKYEGKMDHEKRLFYVAITRAKKLLCLSSFQKKKKNNTEDSEFLKLISPFIKELTPSNNLPLHEIPRESEDNELEFYSAGEILTYQKCPFFYRLRELWSYKPGLVEALGYGKSLHFCLKYASELIKEGTSPEKAAKKAVEEKFHIPYAGKKLRENMKDKAKELLADFATKYKEDMHRIGEAESRIEFPLQNAIVSGQVDVILKDEEEVEIRDYKTSDEVTTYNQAALQIRLYALGLQMAGYTVREGSVAYLEEGDLKKIDINKDNLKGAQEKARETIQSIKNKEFPPKTNYCHYCDHQKICIYKENDSKNNENNSSIREKNNINSPKPEEEYLMGSKYDNFWLEKLSEISSLLQEANQKGKSSKLNVSDLKSYGKRKIWYGVVEVSSTEITKGEMAHARSLGKVVYNNLYGQLSDKTFRLIINSNLELIVTDKDQLNKENNRILNNDNVKNSQHVIGSETGSNAKNDNNKAYKIILSEINDIFSQIPWESWEYIVKKEPEWEHMCLFLKDYGYGPFATLMVAAGLNDFQLKGKAETTYWPPIKNLLKNSPVPSSPAHLERILKTFYEKERNKKIKLSRLNKFLNSKLANLLWNSTPDSASRTFLYIWRELSKTMNQDKQAKTIVFAMKCLGISLMMVGKNDFDYNKIPIPVDYRIIKFTNNIGLYDGEEEKEKEIQKIWSNILNNLNKEIPGITMIHIDSLVWQIASMNEKELKSFFENLNASKAGEKLADLINKSYPPTTTNSRQKTTDTEAVSSSTEKEELNFASDVDVVCFLPCCKTKSPTGKIITPIRSITKEDLPNTWGKLQSARVEMEYCIEKNSPRTSAIYLYTGSPYDAFSSSKSLITESIIRGNIRLIIISAGYGIIDALEPIHDYNEVMNKNAAKHWKDNNLPTIIADYLLNKKPQKVYGFFAGKDNWNNPSSKYRFFFTEGVKLAIDKGLNAEAGCFYRKEGRGPKQILGALGKTFWEFFDSDFNEDYINYVTSKGKKEGNVIVNFDSINN